MAESANDPWDGINSTSRDAEPRGRRLPPDAALGRTITLICITILLAPQLVVPFLNQEDRGRAIGGACCGWVITGYLFYAMYDGLMIARWIVVTLYLLAGSAAIWFGMRFEHPILIAAGSIYIPIAICLGFLPPVTRFLRYQRTRVR
jgi:hypothetical protein